MNSGMPLAVTSTLLLAALAAPFSTAAAPVEPALGWQQFRLDSWKVRDGLPSDVVRSILQTREGYLWIGTQEGLARFDGVRFEPFDGVRQPQMVDTQILGLLEDLDGALWVASDGGGLARLDHHGVQLYAGAEGPGHLFVRAIAGAPNGDKWVASQEGVARLAGTKWTRFGKRDGLPNASVRALAIDGQGRAWAGTDHGVARWDGTRFSVVSGGPSDTIAVQVVAATPDGDVYVGTSEGLWRWRANAWHLYDVAQGLAGGSVTAVAQDRDGRIWVATAGGGLGRLQGERAVMLGAGGPPCHDRIASLHGDREGGLWLGTKGCGLWRMAPRLFTSLGVADGLSGDTVSGVHGSDDGTVWIAVRHAGLNRWRDGRIEVIDGRRHLGCQDATGVFASRRGGVWVNCDIRGRWHDDTFSPLALPGTNPGWILETRDGDVWLANSLARLRGNALTTHAGPAPPARPMLYEAPSGRLWAAEDGAVMRWDGERFVPTSLGPRDAGVQIVALHESDDGALWIGTQLRGVRRLKAGKVSVLGAAQGLPSDRVFAILEDDRARLWLSGSRGIYWIARSEADAVAEGRRSHLVPHLFSSSDGVTASAYGGGHPAAWKAPDGRLWFATNAGVVVFDPTKIVAEVPPRALVEQVRLDGRTVAHTGGTIRLGPALGDLEVTYTAFLLAAPEKLRFRHRLEPFDAAWVDAGPLRSARYPKLLPGDYRFSVVASADGESWSDPSPAGMFAVDLAAPFYRTAVFYALVACVVGAALFGLHRRRLRQIDLRHGLVLAERSRLAREIHDTLAQSLAGAVVQLDCVTQALASAPLRATEHLSRARAVVQEGLEEARRSVWALRPRALDGTDLPTALRHLAGRIVVAGGPQIHVTASGSSRPLPARVEEGLWRIGGEALRNAVRHAGARNVWVALTYAPESVALSIRDDGSGLPAPSVEATSAGGAGIIGMRERADTMGAGLTIDSGPQGTDVRVKVLA